MASENCRRCRSPPCRLQLRVLAILAKYAAFGVHAAGNPQHRRRGAARRSSRFRSSKGPTTAYVKKLAQDAGYVFYLEPGPLPGMSRAYWGPEIRIGIPQPPLTTGMDALTNVEQLSFHFDREAKSIPVVYFHDQQSKFSIGLPIPDIRR